MWCSHLEYQYNWVFLWCYHYWGGCHHEGVESKFASTSHDTLSVLKHPNGHHMKYIVCNWMYLCYKKCFDAFSSIHAFLMLSVWLACSGFGISTYSNWKEWLNKPFQCDSTISSTELLLYSGHFEYWHFYTNTKGFTSSTKRIWNEYLHFYKKPSKNVHIINR